ncbi:hypothetical protein NG799_02280 [Laspinema sp. D1]|uniref:Uncharacterized protein n=1 Tax=Laspinema palackyanum D2a TaxID=2953684 RepID=A0ABT2MMD0_9CYAN|nr:hypothetical protein [Laspinema sp. D2a]
MAEGMEISNLIMTPEDEGFYQWLLLPPPSLREKQEKEGEHCALVADDSGMLRPVNSSEFSDYWLGGEYDYVFQEFEELECG